MGERKWTKEQLSAIEERGKTLLVSAAAGSGKTATLTERITRTLLSEDAPDITSLLIVTFTNAAAAELRSKLSSALEEAVRKNPDNARLKKQLCMLPLAKIRTIDSFCNEVLRQNCDRVGLSPNYRIADGAECQLLSSSILEGLIDSIYEGREKEIASAEDFESLAECLTDSKRSEELSEVFRYVYERCECSENGVDSLLPLIEYYNPKAFTSVEKSVHGSYLMSVSSEMLGHYKQAFSKYESLFSFSPADKYLDTARSDLSFIRSALSASSYKELRELMLSFSPERKPSVKGDKTAEMLSYSVIRDSYREDVSDFKSYFLYTEEEWESLFSSLFSTLMTLYRLLKKFDRLFTEEKVRRNALSYSDIERFCYQCLIKNGELTDIAKSLKNRFSYVYIDEYQDVNSLQNRIFEAVSRENNRFMVGDIKQSIYGFRHARPEIFSAMKADFPPLSCAAGSSAAVFMSGNFRCDRGIIDFVNGIFDKVFSLIGSSIGYNASDRLGYAKMHEGGEPEYKTPTVCMLDKGGEVSSADAVALKIEELLAYGELDSGERIRPSDIAIIMRNASGKDFLYAQALEKRGIPAMISGAGNFFLSSEILLALCLLNSIDNPKRDIYLAGLLCSPLFSFTPDELYLVRLSGGETLYDSLVAYCRENPDFQKGCGFLSSLSYYRAISEGVGVDTLIHKLYHETGLLALASKNGGRENLTLLYEYARSYEAGAYKGLYNFINFINNVIDKKTTFDDRRDGGESDAVKIVTCHASKGLEYPIVFLVEASGRFSNKDKANRLAFSQDFGISLRLRTPSGLAVVNNPVQDIINYQIYRKLYEEELRVLYVALTRAREQLYIIGVAPTEKRGDYEEKLEALRQNTDSYSIRTLSSPLEVVLVAGKTSLPLRLEEFLPGFEEKAGDNTTAEEPIKKAAASEPDNKPEKPGLSEELYKRFTYEYPQKHLTVLPEKMSVSKTSPTVLDGSEKEELLLFDNTDSQNKKKRHLPKFAEGLDAEESAKRGIATHYYLQFCDLERLAQGEAVEELDRLYNEGFISGRDKERVRLEEIELFQKSELFKEMLSAKSLYREFRFNVRLPAGLFTSDEEKAEAYRDRDILVQGVIDCLVEYTDGSFGLFDYKTDRLTREELLNRNLAEKTLRQKHSVQLSYYALAVEKIFGKAPKRVEIYSLPLGDTVSVK